MKSRYHCTTRFLSSLAAVALTPLPALTTTCTATAVVGTLHNFAATYTDGSGPRGLLVVGTDGNLYGTTNTGGPDGMGTVFRTDFAGKITVLHNFAAVDPANHTNSDGAHLAAGVIQGSDGNFYGTAGDGGAHGAGTIFKISATGVFTTLYSFTGADNQGENMDGANPSAALVQGTDGDFYGTAWRGGVNGNGTVFKITAAGAFTNLHSFSVRNGNGENVDGCSPAAALIQAANGNFIGTCSGGGSHNTGTVFQLLPSGLVFALNNFNDVDSNGINTGGSLPCASVIQGADGACYGTTISGGAHHNGTVFRVTVNGFVSTLHDFGAKDGTNANADGASPSASLVQDAQGNLYGTANSGGTGSNGTLFKVSLDGVFTTLHSFAADNSSSNNNGDGASPLAGLVAVDDGIFYGVAAGSGYGGNGSIFEIDANGTFVVTHLFTNDLNVGGSNPAGALLQANDGNLYGVAASSGRNGSGAFLKITTGGTFTSLHDFAARDAQDKNTDGAFPLASVIQGTDGSFYGTTIEGGANGEGTAWKITPAGNLTVLHTFADGASGGGAAPMGGLVQGGDGNFYGTAQGGGIDGSGTVYRLTSSGAFVALYKFSALDTNGINSDGAVPGAALSLGSDGNFYGTAEEGGSHATGTIFRITAAGTLTVLHSFGALDSQNHTVDGAVPMTALALGSDGDFYGTTPYGGDFGAGVVFKITPGGTFTVLHHFSKPDSLGHSSDGYFPFATLFAGKDGSLYGTDAFGGANGAGVIFRITTGGSFTTLHDFGGVDGISAECAPIQAGNGIFYGCTSGGGSANNGVIYTMTLNPAITSALTATASVGKAFSYQIGASNGPTSYGVRGLPAGLVTNASGKISGTPTTAGTYSVTIAAYNSAGSGSKTLTLTVNPAAPVITSALTATATVGQAFAYQIVATNNPASYGVRDLPAGLTTSSTGKISGTPATAGTYSVTIAAYNAGGSGSKTLTLTVKAAPPVITSALTATAQVGKAFSYQIVATNNPTSYGVRGLPAGLTTSSTGKIRGTPTTAGTYSVTIAAYNAGGSSSKTLTLTVKTP